MNGREALREAARRPNSSKADARIFKILHFSPFLSTPPVMSPASAVRVTSYPAIKNAPLVGLAEGNGSFNNLHLAGLVLTVPYFLKWFLPIVNRGGFKTYLFFLVISGVPTTIAYWTFMSHFGARRNEKVILPGKDIEEYITIKDEDLKRVYKGKDKIPMQIFHDAYFEGKIDFNGQRRVPVYPTRLIDISWHG